MQFVKNLLEKNRLKIRIQIWRDENLSCSKVYSVMYRFTSSPHISCIHLVPTETNKRTGHQDPKQRLTKQRPAG